MIGTRDAHVTDRADFHRPDTLAWDLATLSGTLNEIATTWRRALPHRPDLPLELPQRLADMATQLAVDARSLAGADQDRAPALAARMLVLSEGTAYARAITAGQDVAGLADAALWEYLRPALSRTAG